MKGRAKSFPSYPCYRVKKKFGEVTLFMVFKKTKSIIFVLVNFSLLTAISSFSANAFDASVGLEKQKTTELAETVKTEKTAAVSDNDIHMGKQLYGNTCLFCHGPKGVGSRAPSLITGHWGPGGANDDAYMMDVIMNGRINTIMGAFKDSHSEKEIKLIIAYLRHEAKLLSDSKVKK